MRRWFSTLWGHLIVPALSGLLLVMAYPANNWWGIAWFGLVPLLLVLSTRASGFVAAEIYGIAFSAATFYWILEVGVVQWYHLAIIAVFLGTYFGLFGFLFACLRNRIGTTNALLAAPFVWVAVEYIRAHMGFMAHPWPLVGHSQVYCPVVAHVSALTGAYGLSFLLVLANATLTAAILSLRPMPHAPASKFPKRILASMAGATILLVTLTLFYGWHITRRPAVGTTVKIGVVQANIAQNKIWDPRYAPTILEIYSDLTREIAREQPDLIVWPEAATPRAINVDRKSHRKVQ